MAGSVAASSWFFGTGNYIELMGAAVAAQVVVRYLVPSAQKDLAIVGSSVVGPAAVGLLLAYRGQGSLALYVPIVAFALEFFSQYLFELI